MVQQRTEVLIDNQQTEAANVDKLTEPEQQQLTEPTIVSHFAATPISIKQRKGRYIVTFDIVNIDKIDFNLHVNRCLQQKVFDALRKNTIHKPKTPRKLDTVANLTPEQLAKKELVEESIIIVTKQNSMLMLKNIILTQCIGHKN